MSIVYFEDRFIPFEKASIPISDRGFQFGDGAFATIQVRDGVPLFLTTHLEQLECQCRAFNLTMPHVSPEIIEELIQRNQVTDGIWRLKIIVTGGDTSEIRLPKRQGRLVIFLKPFQPLECYPLTLGIFPIPFYLCHASYKSLAHLNRLYLMEEANIQGVDDCVTLTEEGVLLEAAFGNLFWVKDKTFYTPDPALPIYFGVTIKNSLKIAQELGFEIEYVRHSLLEIPDKAFCFRVNTMQGIWPVSQIGEKTFSYNRSIETLFIKGYESLMLDQKKAASVKDAAKISIG